MPLKQKKERPKMLVGLNVPENTKLVPRAATEFLREMVDTFFLF